VLAVLLAGQVRIGVARPVDSTHVHGSLLRYTHPAVTRGALSYQVHGSLYYGGDDKLVSGIKGQSTIQTSNGKRIEPGGAQLYTGNLGFDLGVHRFITIGVDVPVYMDQAGWGPTAQTFGDLLLSVTAAPPNTSMKMASGGIRVGVTAPTGNHEDGFFPREVYYIVPNPKIAFDDGVMLIRDKWFIHPVVLGSLNLKESPLSLPLELHLNAGAVITDTKDNFTVNGAFALAYRPVRPLMLAVEAAGQWRPMFAGRSFTEALAADPLRCVPTVAVDLPGGFSFSVAGDIGLSNGAARYRSNWHKNGYIYGTKALPQIGGAVFLRYCGSFAPLIRKARSARPDYAAMGPKGDRDNDSIPDTLDACPGTPEDRDGYQDRDGCPDYDNEADGVADEIDKCPDEPEDIDRFDDADGCPDPDNDGDEIPDSLDACPNDKGSADNRGCPETGALTFVRTVLTSVAFEPGSSKIVSGSDILDGIFKELQKSPSAQIEFQVHTDNRGSMENCRLLSQSRADVLKLYLIAKGIRPDRIKAIGMGSEFPISDNSTEEGRLKNQRVEVRRIQ
jgi:outer membrane protein OmpA-like peptidoglycan-associated protein